MSAAIAKREPADIIEQVIAKGDLKELTPAERTDYYKAVCDSIGLNSLTKPFEYITLNGKLTLYARKDATDQLRKIHGVSVQIASRERIDDVYTVTARATDARGRTDESVGAVAIGNLKGDALCNAIMKAETKAKRRVTLSICGLGMLDEAELETIPRAPLMPGPEMSEVSQDVYAAVELERPEVEPEPVRPVRLEGAQPTQAQWALPELPGAAGHVIKLAKGLGWNESDLAQCIEANFGVTVGSMKGYLELASKDELRELYRIMNSQGKGGR